MRSVLVKVRGPVLGFEGEGFKALGHGLFMLLLLLGEGISRGHAGGGGAVAGSGPHRRLQHLHGLAPLGGGGRDAHLVQGRTGIGHGVGVSGVLPRCFRGPGFRFAFLCSTGREPLNHSTLLKGKSRQTKRCSFLPGYRLLCGAAEGKAVCKPPAPRSCVS